MDTNPDHLEAQGVELMYKLVSSPEVLSNISLYLTIAHVLQDSVLVAVLDWMLICCVRHEGNRQALVDR